MLYAFEVAGKKLDPLTMIDPGAAGVKEDDIEKTIADRPTSIFRREASELPLLIVKKSVQGARMADIIALDGEGRLVLVECKRGWATRETLAQLLDYASEYHPRPASRLKRDWASGEGAGGKVLLDSFRAFADDPTALEERLGQHRVLVVVAAGRDEGFERIARMMRSEGVQVYFVPIKLFRRGNGEFFLEVEPIELPPAGTPALGLVPEGDEGASDGSDADQDDGPHVWMINTDEAHSPGATQRFLETGVAAVWGYEDGPARLQRGVRAGDTIYAYSNGQGIVARGSVAAEEVKQATPTDAVIPQCKDGNEWHIAVKWEPVLKSPVSNADVRTKTGVSLPVRSSFCRLWDPKVQSFLEQRAKG